MYLLAFLPLLASAKTVVITVGGNTTDSPQSVFQPQTVSVIEGDSLIFNFTHGNHSATQSTFSSPCIPAHFTNQTINSFDSGPRLSGNFSAITILTVPITNNDTFWFYDINLCAKGGVGGANVNESSFETIEGFERNAIRLNGTGATSTATSTSSATHTSATTTSTQSASSNANALLIGAASTIVPILIAILAISL